MAEDLPSPPVPPDADLKDFPFTPIYRARLFGSAFHAKVSDSEWRAGVTLWLKSQDQQPAGSLPDDDVELCRLAEFGRDLKTWKKVKEGALHGWYRCNDGRLYHDTVAETVIAQWDRRDTWREKVDSRKERQARWRAALKERSARLREMGITPPRGASLETLDRLIATSTAVSAPSTQASLHASTRDDAETRRDARRDAVEIAYKGEGEGESSVPNGTGAGAPPADEPDGDLKRIVFNQGLDYLAKATGRKRDSLRSIVGKWVKDHGEAVAIEVIGACQRVGNVDPIGWIEKGLRARAGPDTGWKPRFPGDMPPG